MAASGSAGPRWPRGARRSIRFTLAAMVTVPVVGLVLLWAVAVGGILAAEPAGRSSGQQHRDLAWALLLTGAGLVVVIAAALVLGSFAARLSGDISGLAASARCLAGAHSPWPEPGAGPAPGNATQVTGPGAGQIAGPADGTARPRTKATEIAQAEAAIASLQHTAAAAAEVSLRDGLSQVFISLARRNQSLLQRQLRLIDALEQKASDPAALADLFSLDHLTTRMRRQAESLAVLSGAATGRTFRQPVPVIDIIRGAMAEVEDYTRVTPPEAADDAVIGSAAADMIHLLAELIENATLCSPSGTEVEVRADLVAHGLAVEVDDRGLGIEPGQLEEINRKLASPPAFDLADADRLGLFVAGKLAAKHGVRVSLRSSPHGGTTAIVLMPPDIIVPAAEADPRGGQPPGAWPERAGRATVSRLGTPADQDRTAPGDLAVVPLPTADTYNGLPRRARQASLSPHLRGSSPASAAPSGADPAVAPSDARAPERARDLAAAWQSGWQHGRKAQLPARPTADCGPEGPAAPQDEEG
jgi:signal transduction histidine kinase